MKKGTMENINEDHHRPQHHLFDLMANCRHCLSVKYH